MSNLGGYQLLTILAKKVGGPYQLMGALVAGGVLLSKGVSWGISKLNEKQRPAEADKIYTVITDGDSNEGFHFSAGNNFRVLAVAGDVGLIELIGNHNNPYYVSRTFLSAISDYSTN